MLDRTHRFRRAGATAAVAIAVVMLAGCGDSTGPKNNQNALRPAGTYARQILHLTEPFFWVAVIVGLGVIGGTFFVALRFREKPGEERSPKQIHGNTVLEISWTVIPAVILAIMAVPTVATIFSLAKKPTGPNVVHVTVSARQWWWQFHLHRRGQRRGDRERDAHSGRTTGRAVRSRVRRRARRRPVTTTASSTRSGSPR